MKFVSNKIKKILLVCALFLTIVPMNTLAINAEEPNFTILDDMSSEITYSQGGANNGGWESWGSRDYLETEHWSNSAGGTISFTFTGTKLELYGKKDPSHAKFSVSIDGETESVFDEYNAETKANALIYESRTLESTSHEVVVKVLAERNELSTGTENVYGFQFSYAKIYSSIELETETVVMEIDDTITGTDVNQFNFIGTWVSEKNAVSYNETEHWTNKNKWGSTLPSVSLKFKGNKIELFGQKENTGAIYKAVLDGDEENAIEIDTYNLSKQPPERLYIKEGLSEGEHTIVLTVLNKINVLGGTYDKVNVSAVIDYAKVTSLETVSPDKTYKTEVDNTDVTTKNEMFKYQFEGPGWVQGTGSNAFYKGTEAYADSAAANNSFYTMKFIGSGVKIIASKNTGHADYEVFIDDVKVGDALAKLASGEAQHGQTLFEKYDIEYGEHTLKVAAKAGSSGAIQADAVIITHKAIKATSISFDKEALSIESGLTGNVSAKINPSYATGNIEYSIANINLATISDTGEVTALKEGKTTINAIVKGTDISTSIPLTILPEGIPLTVSVGNPNFMATQDDYDKILTQAKTSWNDEAWRGDILNSKIDLASKKAVNNVTIKSSDFKSGNNTIKASNVEVNWLKETLANIGRGNGGAPVKPFPDVIYNNANEELDLAARKVQSAWININVPKDAKPGQYTGKMTVEADELEEPTVLDFSFEVLDLVQPEPQDMDTQVQIWQHPFSVANYYGVAEDDYFDEPHLKYMRESMKEYASLGGKDVVANIVDEAWGNQSYYGDPTMVNWIKNKDGNMVFDYEWFDKWITFNIESGVLDPENGIGQIKCFSIVPWSDNIRYFDEASGQMKTEEASVGSTVWTAAWTAFLTDFMAHMEEKGWFDITYISLDERPMNRVGPSVDLIKSIKNKDKKSFKISSAFNYESGSDYSFLDKIDDISIGLSHVNDNSNDMKNMAAHRKELGLLTTIYTCTGDYPGNYTISEPVDNAWCMWYTMTQNTDGYMKWAWDNWVQDPLTNVTYKFWEPGDGWFVYPTEKGEISDTYYYKTPRYEMLKQGTRDINKAKYIAENSKTLRTEVDTLVKSLKRPKKGGNGYGSAVPESEADRLLAGSEVIRMREGINDLAREYIKESPTNIPVTSITVDRESVTLTEGESVTIKATALPETASDKTLIWSSSDDKVATVEDGNVKAMKAGTTTITVKNEASGVTKEIIITVKAKNVIVTSIAVDRESAILIEGESVTIKATALPEMATNKTLTWSSSDNNVATVKGGVIKAIKAGTTTITVKNEASGVTKEIKITVKTKVVIPENTDKITNNKGDVSVYGKFPSSLTLTTTFVDEKEVAKIVLKASEKNKDYFLKYKIEQMLDIQLYDGNTAYQPNDNVVVKIKLSSDLIGKQLNIIHIREDGSVEELESNVEDGYIVFVTTHFSKFAIVSPKAATIDKIEGGNTNSQSPATGDQVTAFKWIVLALFTTGVILCIGKKHRKIQ